MVTPSVVTVSRCSVAETTQAVRECACAQYEVIVVGGFQRVVTDAAATRNKQHRARAMFRQIHGVVKCTRRDAQRWHAERVACIGYALDHGGCEVDGRKDEQRFRCHGVTCRAVQKLAIERVEHGRVWMAEVDTERDLGRYRVDRVRQYGPSAEGDAGVVAA